MSRSSAPVLTLPRLLLLPLLQLLLLLIDASSAQTVQADGSATNIGCSVESCAALDVAALLREYVTGLQPPSDADQPLMPDELPSDEQLLLPFGALASDWKRLALLQNSQPEGSALRDNLLRLSRLVLAAYFIHSQDVQDASGENIAGTISDSPDSSAAPGSEDQQANNVTLGSTVQKESARINASSAGGAHNNGEEPGSEKFAGNDGEDSAATTTTTTTSYYADSTSADFNQAFSTLVSLDNEASGSKSNETSLAADNEDESTTTKETWPESFSRSSSSASLDHDGDSGFASSGNEAIHPRSKENYLVSRYASKEARREDDDDDDDLVARFFAEEHDEAAANSENSMEDLLALMELEEAELLANESTSEPPTSPGDSEQDYGNDSFEFNATKSLEALLDSMERLSENTTSTDDFELSSAQPSSDLITEESSTETAPIALISDDDNPESQELLELIDGLSAEDDPTSRLVQMISGKLSSYSNEAAAAAAAVTENDRGRTDRSEEYTDTTLPSLYPTTDKAPSENRTRDPDERGPFQETRATTVDAPQPDDWASSLAIDDTTSSYAAEPLQQRESREILTIFRQGEAASAGSSGKLREAKEEQLSAWPTEPASASFNPASLENRMDREPAGIAGMNKRKRGGGGEPLL